VRLSSLKDRRYCLLCSLLSADILATIQPAKERGPQHSDIGPRKEMLEAIYTLCKRVAQNARAEGAGRYIAGLQQNNVTRGEKTKN
jgi:hypothetical protein